MSTPKAGAVLGAAAFALGLSLAGPLPAGIAFAAPADDPTSAAADAPGPVGTPRASARGRSARVAAAESSPSTPRPAAARALRGTSVAPGPAPSASRRAATIVDSDPSPAAETTVATTTPLIYRAASVADVPTATGPIGRVPTTGPIGRVPAPAAATGRVSSPVGAVTASATASLSGGLATNPIADFLNGLMLMVRRFFFNQAPRAVPVQAMVRPNGQVWGVVLGSDPEGEPVTYALTRAPAHGTVSLTDQGVYTYVPTPGFTGTDTFTVTVDDPGFHINLLNLFNDRTRVAVTVSVGGADPVGTVVDTFDGAAGSAPDPALWTRNTGAFIDSGVQTYTDAPENVRLDGEGHLVIQARTAEGGFTSGEVITRGNLDMTYGSMTARIKFPSGQGVWPAFWMLGSTYSHDTWYAQGPTGWPGCGEIDVMELVNSGTTYHVALHGPQGVEGTDTYSDYYGGVDSGQFVGAVGSIRYATGGRITDLAAGFHDYWVIREPDIIVIGVDDTMLATFTPDALPSGGQWVFNQPMYAILNVAVGGTWPGPPDETTPWPLTMTVDSFKFTPTA